MERRGVVRWIAVWAMILAACGTNGDVVVVDTSQAAESSAATQRTAATEATTTFPADCTPSSSDAPETAPATTEQATAATTTTTTEPATTTEPPTTQSVTTSEPDESDAELAERQATLSALGYWLGDVDGEMGPSTAHAVTAFQKAEGLERTGQFDAATLERLEVATRPSPQASSGTVLEVDLQRQVLFAAADGTVRWTFDIATGASATPTPPGQYEIYNEIDGFRHAPLGTLYRPKYFNGGIAFHGYTSVPAQPASHGCVRLTYAAIDFLWDAGLAPMGTTVLVY